MYFFQGKRKMDRWIDGREIMILVNDNTGMSTCFVVLYTS